MRGSLRGSTICLLLAQLLWLGACATTPPLAGLALPAASVELTGTPFFPQADYQCGPAALATTLVASGASVTPETLVEETWLPGRKGSLQAELIAATRRHHRVPYVLQPEMGALLAEVAAGQPVLVLQNTGFRHWPAWHYAVVIGYSVEDDSILLRSGKHERLRLSRARFEREWSRGGRWALLTTSAERIPATAEAFDWLKAANAFEELEQPATAAVAYATATQRWPQVPVAWQALANARHALGDTAGAEVALRMALFLESSAASHNNLALLLLERGCRSAALDHIRQAVQAEDAGNYAESLAGTRARVEAATDPDRTDCPARPAAVVPGETP